MKIVLIGIQGSGKGTQVANLKENFDFNLVSMGELMRLKSKSSTKLGKQIKALLDKGEMIDNETVISVLEEKLKSFPVDENVVFDGFPRSLEQAELLNKITKIDLVIYFKLSKKTAISRLVNRLTCKDCGNVSNKDLSPNRLCKACGGMMTVRDDDNAEAISKRIEIFNTQTYPLIKYYKKQGILEKINANQKTEKVFASMYRIIEKYERNNKN